ncbi:MAG TPA: hypothetical protein VFX30_11205 [bacterium]|nr:hypothetical protein [bacterium]
MKRAIGVLVFLFLLVPIRPAFPDSIDDGQAAADYLNEYQSEQSRNSLLLRGLLGLFLGAGAIAVVLRNKNKGKKPGE